MSFGVRLFVIQYTGPNTCQFPVGKRDDGKYEIYGGGYPVKHMDLSEIYEACNQIMKEARVYNEEYAATLTFKIEPILEPPAQVLALKIGMSHVIDANEVRFIANPDKEGNALRQFENELKKLIEGHKT